MSHRKFGLSITVMALLYRSCEAWTTSTPWIKSSTALHLASRTSLVARGGASVHGENTCFLPLLQLDQDYYAPRIVQIAGAYPGLTKEEFEAVQSEPAPTPGQWNYDFSDPDGPQVGTVALEGSNVVAGCEDPVVIIAEHFALGVPLPSTLVDPVDLLVLVDRSKKTFAERKFLVVSIPGQRELIIGAYQAKSDVSSGAEILGQVVLVQIPWLPAMKPTKSGFMEVDEYFGS